MHRFVWDFSFIKKVWYTTTKKSITNHAFMAHLGVREETRARKIFSRKLFRRQKSMVGNQISLSSLSYYLITMIITYHGVDFFKVQFGDTVLAVNPISKDSSHKGARFGSDVTLISLNSPEHNGKEVTSRGDKESFVISGPGEYEVGGVFIKGFLSKSKYGGEEHINTIYTVNLEGMTLGFLGALSDPALSDKTKEGIGAVDVLFVPIGGTDVLEPAIAHKLSVQFESKIIIPSHFGDVGAKDALKMFLKEAGAENTKPIDKLTIKRKDIDAKENEVVVLEVV